MPRNDDSTTITAQQPSTGFLVIQTGPRAGTAVPVDHEGMTIGRDPTCGLSFVDQSVSRNHCEIVRIGSQWGIRDLDSSNGTRLNGKELRSTTVHLQYGDLISVGSSQIRFSATNQAKAVAVESQTNTQTAIFRHDQALPPKRELGLVAPPSRHDESVFILSLLDVLHKRGSFTTTIRDLVNREGTHRAQKRLRIEAVRNLAGKLAAAGIVTSPSLLSLQKSPGIEAEVRLCIDAGVRAIPLVNVVEPIAYRPKDMEEDTWALVRSTADRLGDVLRQLNVSVEELQPAAAQVGPSVIRFRVRVSASTKLSTLQARAPDIGRALSAQQAPIIDNIQGENYVGIDVARKNPVVLEFAPVSRSIPSKSPASIPFVVGIAPDAREIILDLAELPHLLVAGSTGSGKTVFLQALILSALGSSSGADLELVIIDPKETDFALFNGLPQLHARPVITDPTEAINYLRDLLEGELPRRTEALASSGHRNLSEYLGEQQTPRIRPMIIVVDEFADLVMQFEKKARKLFERDVCRIAQRARSVGIHLVLATQRPSVDVVTGLIKANMPCRIAFRVPQIVDSRTILDRGGAENLLGKGDMLLLRNDVLQRLQGFNVPAGILRRAITEVKTRA